MDQQNERDQACPRRYGRAVDRLTGEFRSVNCNTYGCGWCGPRLALATAAAIQLAAPRWSDVFTFRRSLWAASACVEREDFPSFHGAVKRLASLLRGDGYRWEVAWVLETSPRGIVHCHLVQSGSDIPDTKFAVATEQAGFGWGRSQVIRHVPVLARYILKGPIRGLDLSLTQAAKVMDAHLRLNGGWLIRYTRQFWRALDGRVLGGVNQARIEALKSLARSTRPVEGGGKGASGSRDRYPSESYAAPGQDGRLGDG